MHRMRGNQINQEKPVSLKTDGQNKKQYPTKRGNQRKHTKCETSEKMKINTPKNMGETEGDYQP